MARYTGPRTRIVRRLGTELPGLTRRSGERRPNPPGQHGAARRQLPSDYRVRLEEKQKLRAHYGISERQLMRYYSRASSKRGDTGEILLIALESRLDNVVFRAGFAPTIPAARQLISHGHLAVNARRITFPSYAVAAGDIVSLHRHGKGLAAIEEALANPVMGPPSYLHVDAPAFTATLTSAPSRADVPLPIREALVVEYYS